LERNPETLFSHNYFNILIDHHYLDVVAGIVAAIAICLLHTYFTIRRFVDHFKFYPLLSSPIRLSAMDLSATTDHAIIFYQTSEVVHPVELKRHCGDT